ncbi:MAG TPA: F0F1 ATP synthase subunit alpha [Patescibacteria group bacterium]|nr:F0F1 ATP synthase subunit alpha [Patescibacteria group bacterium]
MAQAELIIKKLKEQIHAFEDHAKKEAIGTVLEVGDGIAMIAGLPDVASSEIILFETRDGAQMPGLALNLEEDRIGAVIFGNYKEVMEGDVVRGTGKIFSVPVGEKMVGRVLNGLLAPVDGKGAIVSDKEYSVEKIAPGVITREPVTVPLQTGIKAIDAMIPIGRGQRELIIGDRQTGKTAIALDTIINQKGQDVICIYVAIGQREAKIRKIVATLEKHGALDYTTVVLTGASDPASLIYLSPYAATALGEYFMDQGKDVLIVYDDLSKHAQAYRQVSLLLRRPPGREAYPGDVFYLHSRLLERAARRNAAHGGGSITALPIIETQAGDVSAYIPTNVISITDGQIYLETDLFYKGVRPALNVGLSVSRVGGAAQIKAMKSVSGKLRLGLAQYRELEAFAQFGSDVDEETRKQLERGKRTIEVLKQDQYKPLSVAQQVTIIYALTSGHLDDVAVERIKAWEEGFGTYCNASHAALLADIATRKELTEDIVARLEKAIKEFKEVYQGE